MSLPVVAIVGRPNVGKSTIFNRLVRRRTAIVDNQPGVTRDRLYATCQWEEKSFILIDTGGYELDSKEELTQQMRDQTELAIEEADLVLFIMDAKEGPLDLDKDIIRILLKAGKKVIFVINKVDGPKRVVHEFYSLGVTFHSISAEHSLGISDLIDEMIKQFPCQGLPKETALDEVTRVAIIGRPNVGKSSLVNSILRKDRMLVTDIPGTTRDSVDSQLRFNKRQYTLVDTAGIRKKGKTKLALEKYSVITALKHLQSCDVALILVDAFQGIKNQDITIAGYAFEERIPCIIVVNKWDLIEKDNKTVGLFKEEIRYQLKYLPYAPIVFVSALTGLRVFSIFTHIEKLYDQYTTKVTTSELNKIIQKITEKNPPPTYRGRRIKFYYQTQISVKPPSFLFFLNYPEALHFSYERYLQNQLRNQLKIDNIPIKVFFKKRKNLKGRK